MGYYVRVFCTSSVVPPLREVLEWVAEEGQPLKVDPNFPIPVELDSPHWKEVELLYKADRQPLVVDLNRDDDSDSLFRQEIEQFQEELSELPASAKKERVLQHLIATRYIVAIQLLSDFDDDGAEALSVFTGYFIHLHGGMVQMDSKGFYDGDKLLLRLA